MILIFYIIIGLVTGLLSGLLGIGGGVISVPALFYILHYYGFDQTHLMHICIATSLGATLITSIGSSFAHHKKHALLPSVLKIIIPGLILGCILGAFITTVLPSHFLQIFFGIMSLLLSGYFLFPTLLRGHIANAPTTSLSLFGVVIGALSTLLGVGGGIFMVPVLLAYRVALQNAVASSSVGTLTTAIAGTGIYLFLSRGNDFGPNMIGFISVPALVGIGVSSLLTAPLGAKLAHILPTHIISKIFAIALAVTGLSMIFS